MRLPPLLIAIQEGSAPFRKSRPRRAWVVICFPPQADGMRKEGNAMAKERFVEVYNQGLVNVAKIIVDTETGVNYLMGSHNKQAGTGMTVLVDADGKPIVTPMN